MRIRFPDADDAREKKIAEKRLRAIDDWWKAFAGKVEDLDALFSRRKSWDLPKFMQRHLGAIDPRIMWEFGAAISGRKGAKHRLVLTPESEHALRPLVELVLSRAPALRAFELYDHRVAEDLATVAPTVEARLSRALPETTVQVTAGEHGTVDLRFFMQGCKRDEDANYTAIAFVASETLLGEDVLDQDIGTISVGPPKKAKGTVGLGELRKTVDKALQARDRAIPDKPVAARLAKATWTLFELKPKPQKDHPGQDDLFVAATMYPELFAATRGDRPFHSRRFSRHGERFAFVKMDGKDGLKGSTFGDRDEIEQALDGALGKKVGAVVGGGTGLRYSYVELSLLDLDEGVARVRRTLREGRIPKRSWILFHDAAYVDEWVGIHPDTPPPPVRKRAL